MGLDDAISEHFDEKHSCSEGAFKLMIVIGHLWTYLGKYSFLNRLYILFMPS